MGLSFPSYKVGLGSDPRVLGSLPCSRSANYSGCSSGSHRSGSVRSLRARCGRVPGRVPRQWFPACLAQHPAGPSFPGGIPGGAGEHWGRGGAAAYKKSCASARATGLCCWNHGACLPVCAAAAVAPRRFPRRPRRVGMCLMDVLEREDGGAAFFFSPKSRDTEGVGCITSCAPPQPPGRRDRENFKGKLCSGVAGRLPEILRAPRTPSLLLCAPVLDSAWPQGSGVGRD